MEYQYAELLEAIENALWGYVGVPVIMALGLYLGYKSRWVQLRCFPDICRNFFSSLFSRHDPRAGLHPMRAFFASIGGSLGIGNVVAVATAITIGGPGTLVWLWITAIVGSLIKYAEVFIGMTHRRYLPDGSTRGGPMFFLRDAFKSSWPASIFCIGMCLYSVEIYQFGVVSNVTARACGLSVWVTALLFLAIIISVERGGFQRVGKIASIVIPCAVVVYVCMGIYVLIANFSILPSVLADIIASSCSWRAAEGGFIGSTCMMAISHGVRRGCYSSDLGIGYASIIHSASTATKGSCKEKIEFL